LCLKPYRNAERAVYAIDKKREIKKREREKERKREIEK
jgi:hypothetical protein